MKQIAFILVCWAFNLANCLVSQAPTWTTNPDLDAGEVVAANQANMATYMAASTVKSFSQHYNRTTFTSPPKVVLAMIGYTQAAPGSPLTDFGFQPVITGIAQLTFTYNITVYGSMIYDLRYLYLAVLEPTPNYYMGIVTQQFSSVSNLNNSAALQRWDTLTFANPEGWVNLAYASSDVQVLAFPIGYKLAAQSGRSYFSINATIVNENFYSVNISTIGTNKLSQLDFSVVMFNRAPLQADYVAYQDIALFNVIGNTSYYFLPTITASQYMFRNCLTGAVHIEFNLVSVALVGFYYGVSSANDDFFVWRTFNNRVRSCPSNLSYYNPVAVLCQDQCAPYYYANTTSKLCLACHASCYSCTQPTTILGCNNCSAADHRSLTNSSCVCDAGYYESGSSVCSACNYRCLTCSSATICLTCNASLSRVISNSSECLCITGYYQNTTCISCGTITGCLTCSYNVTDNNFTCLTCNSSLFRTLSSDNKSCICLNGYYEEASICKPCPVGCLSCTFNGANPVCSSCNTSLQRIMGASNFTCDCIVSYYADGNNSCRVCPFGCLSCSFDGVNPICNNCNASLQRTIGASNYTCDCISSYYADSNNTCIACPIGCMTCAYNGSTPICSSCNSSLQRTMGASNLTCDCLAKYYLNSSLDCLPCPLACLSCSLNSSQLTCSSCDSSLNRILSSNNTTCICKLGFYENSSQLCVACQYACLDCYLSTNLTCRSCDASRVMASSNLTCDCPTGSYQSANFSCLTCPTNCSTCTSNIFCTSCVVGSYLNANNSCLSCSLGCLNCQYNSTSSMEVCLNCSGNLNFVLQSSSCVCATNYTLNGTACSLNPVTNTSNTTNTTTTNTTANNTTNTTTSPCGNGLKQAGEQCDDGNIINSDGCSSLCIIQTDHTCVDNSSLYNHSLCYYSRQIQLNPSLIYKKPGQNSVKIVLIVVAPNCNPSFLKTYLEQASSLALFDKTRRLLGEQRHLQSTSWISVSTKSMIFDPSTGQLIIQFDYDATIDLTKKYIQFLPSTSTNSQGIKYFYASPSSELTLSQPYNHLSTTYYSSSDLSAVSGIRYGFLILVLLYWIFLILTLTRNRGVVGVECMLILQFAYFVLLDQNPLLESWSGLQLTGKYSFGYNPSLFPSSNEMDINALQLDSCLFNTFGLTLMISFLLFLFIVINYLREYIKERKSQENMEINETEENSLKLQKEIPPNKIEKVMVYVIDTFVSLMFLSVGVLFIVILFTNSANLIINMVAAALFITISVVSWILLIRNRENYSYSRISFISILINASKTSFHPLVKKALANYYLLLFILLIIAALFTAVLRKSGLVVLALLAVGCASSIVFHLKFKIYFQMLDSKRCIINSCGLLLLLVIHGICFILRDKLGTGFSMVMIGYVVLLLILAANVLIFVLVARKQLKREVEEQIHNQEMRQMDNELALANISFIGKGYNSINKSREFSKDKDFLNSFDMSSAKKCLLNDEKQVQIVTMIEEKIRELKDFKKNIQAQLQTSQPSDQPQGSEANNLTLENVLGDLNLTKNSNDGIDIEAI